MEACIMASGGASKAISFKGCAFSPSTINSHLRPSLHFRRVSAAYLNPEPATSLNNDRHESDTSTKQNSYGFKRQSDDNWNLDNDDEMLRLMEGFKDSFPIIRTYRNDLCTLEICGSAPRSSVLTAMASDRNFTAASNLLMRRNLTVLQTILPGSSGVHSTVSTKLFAPSLQIVERARKLSLPKGLSAGEFLHKFFEAVQMLHFSKFYIDLHAPGTARNMSALEREEMVQTVYSLEASNMSALDQLGKAISLYAISGLKHKATGSVLLKRLWNTHEWIPSCLSPVRLHMLSVVEIESQANCLRNVADSLGNGMRCSRPDRHWWPVPALGLEAVKRCLDKATEDWIYEHVPMHKMHIDADVLDGQVARDGATPRKSKELTLTHAQLVDLAGALELYYDDRFTLPNKNLVSGAILDFQYVSRSKMAKFFETMALGSMILGAGIFAWLVSARMRHPSRIMAGNLVLNTVDVAVVSKSDVPSGTNSKPDLPVNRQLPEEEMESLCKSVIAKLVMAFSWDVQIQSCIGKGAWTEKTSAKTHTAQSCAEIGSDTPTISGKRTSDKLDKGEKDLGVECESGQIFEIHDAQNKGETLHYQVTLSRNGTVLGVQPLNESAISSWAAMPFAKILHKQRNLKPGLAEWPLKYWGPPKDGVVLELYMDPASLYISARPVPLS